MKNILKKPGLLTISAVLFIYLYNLWFGYKERCYCISDEFIDDCKAKSINTSAFYGFLRNDKEEGTQRAFSYLRR